MFQELLFKPCMLGNTCTKDSEIMSFFNHFRTNDGSIYDFKKDVHLTARAEIIKQLMKVKKIFSDGYFNQQ